MAPARGCDTSRNSNQIASIVREMNSTVYDRMNIFWPSNKGDNNWYVFLLFLRYLFNFTGAKKII